LRLILDCSVAAKWFIPEPLSDVAASLLRRFEAHDLELLAPETIIAELGHALRKRVVAGGMTPEESHVLIDDFVALQIPMFPIRPLASQAMRLTTAHMSTFYDALYISLAIREDAQGRDCRRAHDTCLRPTRSHGSRRQRQRLLTRRRQLCAPLVRRQPAARVSMPETEPRSPERRPVVAR
jgi:predicted nucleic acid-binding protein